MFIRLSRLRSALYRLGFFSLVILIFFQIRQYFSGDQERFEPITLNSRERSFWLRIIDQDQLVSEEDRLERIRTVIDERRTTTKRNWTSVFEDLYDRKLTTLDERDKTNPYKSRLIQSYSSTLPKTFDIFEETPVRLLFISLNRCSVDLNVHRFFNVRNFALQHKLSILNVLLPIVDGRARKRLRIIRIFVVLMFFIMSTSILIKWYQK